MKQDILSRQSNMELSNEKIATLTQDLATVRNITEKEQSTLRLQLNKVAALRLQHTKLRDEMDVGLSNTDSHPQIQA